VEVAITDTGPGIKPEIREKIFQVFFSTKKDGTGMGLPMVRRIVEEHDGTVTLQSELGKGTSFTLFFPCGGPGDLEGRDTMAGSGA
jgi:signal transduction histidine kinase